MVSAECAAALAVNVQQKFSADIGVGLTGAAGPIPTMASRWVLSGLVLLFRMRIQKRLSCSYQDQEMQIATGQRDLPYYLIKQLTEKESQN